METLETLVRDQGNRFWSVIVGAFLALFATHPKKPKSRFAFPR